MRRVATHAHSLRALALALLMVSCRSGGGGGTPDAAAMPLDAGAPRASAVAIADAAVSTPRATRSEVAFRRPWAVLGQNIVDVRSATRARTVPFGELAFAGDGQHFALFDGREVVVGAVSDPAADYVVAVDIDGLYRLSLAPNGSSALMRSRDGATHLVDARARTHVVLATQAPDAGVEAWREPRHVFSADSRRVTWVDGDAARVRELDVAKTRDVHAGGKTASRSEIAGDTLVALFDDELVVMRLSTGAELAHPHRVSDFVLADDGRTLAWEDASARLQTVVFFDAEHAREGRHVAIEDDEATSAPRRYRGACGAGRFGLGPPARIEGAVLSAQRGCSLIDNVTVDLASGAPTGFSSATPADDYADEQRRLGACKRARAQCSERSGVVWVGRSRGVMMDANGKLAVFDVATGQRVALLEHAEDTSLDRDFAVAPDGKAIAAIDSAAVARLWDSATGKLLWSAPADALGASSIAH